MISAEQIVAYVDDELDAAGRAEVEAAVAADAAVAAQVAAHRALRDTLMSAFAPIAGERAPQSIIDTASPSATVIPFRPRMPRPVWQVGALAASLVLGVLLTFAVTLSQGDFSVTNSGLVARGTLASALSRRLASDDMADSAARIGVTFRDQSGAVCRTFTTKTNEGLACRDGGKWRIDVAARAEQHGDYTQAASPLVMQAVSDRIDGDAFDAAAERQARDSGWAVAAAAKQK